MQQAIEGFRLSPQQVRLWLLQQQCAVYCAYCSVLIEGNLRVATLQEALVAVISRNEMYRTSFYRLPGVKVPVQIVNESPLYGWQHYDLSTCQSQEQQRKIAEVSQKGQVNCIDMQQGPLVHCSLLTLNEQRHILFIHLPALYADIHTLYNFVREIALLYNPSAIPADEDDVVQYVQFSEWQNALLEEEGKALTKEHWPGEDISTLSTLTLPFERKLNQCGTLAPDFLAVSIQPLLYAQIEAMIEKWQSTLPALLLTCWQFLLWKLTGQNSIGIGVSVNGRIYDELSEIAGPIAKYMPVTCYISEFSQFYELLAQVKQVSEELAPQHPYFIWEDLDGSAESDTSLHYPFSFDFREQPGLYAAGDVSFTLQQCYSCLEPFKVKIAAVQDTTTLTIEFHYDRSLFDREQIERLAGQFTTLLENAVKQPETAIGELDILSTTERELLLVEFNQTCADYPEDRCLHHLFESQVASTPDAVAVQYGECQLTYYALNVRANQLARYLQKLGVGPEVLVGIYLERSVEVVIAILGILKAGGGYVPFDLVYPLERLAFIIENAQISVLLTTSHVHERLPHMVQEVCLDSNWPEISKQRGEEAPESGVLPANLAYVIYTSGSTGKPKGVMIQHQGVVHYVSWSSQHYHAAAGAGSVVHSPLAFDLTITSLFTPLVVGARVVLVSEDQGIEALGNVLRQENDFSLLKITPAHLDMLSQYLEPEEVIGATRALVIGGEALRGESLATWRLHAPATRLINEYGPTETVVGCCIYEVPAEGLESSNIPIGRPIPNTQLYLLDTRLRPVPIGIPGELYIGGVGLGRGYLKQAGLTAERFIPDPFGAEPGTRLYKTGDLARYVSSDGTIEYLGRIDQQIKLHGYRIELGEIESVLMHHPNVRDAVVLMREDGAGGPRLVAYVVPQQQSAPTGQQLHDFLQTYLPDYMIPFTFVSLKDFPLTANGKVNRQSLPPPLQESGSATYTPPRNPVEEILVDIWEEVLKVKPVGIRDNFFALGGHSLLATQIIARLRRTFKVDLPVRSLFDALTIVELAESVERVLRREQPVKLPPLLPVARDTALPLSFAQQRLWFLDQLEPESIIYLMPSALRLQGALDAMALERSLQELVRRHESLRTTFEMRADQPVQVIHAPGAFRLPVVDLCSLVAEEREQEARRLARQEAQLPCNLTREPLLRTHLLRLDGEEHVVLLTMHHIISDAWSNDVFSHELMALYKAFTTGQPSPLPPLLIQYADFAVWQREWLQGEVLAAMLSYWQHQLADAPPLELPTDHPRPPMQTFHGASQSIQLPLSLYEELITMSRQEGVTLFILLLAAFQVLLTRYGGQTDISIGTPIANRTLPELEEVIGLFVNTLVLRSDLSGNPSFSEALGRVREVALGAYAHQDVPFEQLVEMLQPERDLSRSPLFQVMFRLQQNSVPMETKQERGQELALSKLRVEQTTSRFDMSVVVTATPVGLSCGIQYNTDLFEASTIRQLLVHWQALLQGIIAAPQARLSALPLLSQAEQELLLVSWNATEASFPTEQGLHQLFEAQVERTPDAVALSYERAQISYRELNRRANLLAHYLQQLDVRADVLVGVCLERSVELVMSILAILKAGGAYLPLDPGYPVERLRYLVQDAQATLLLTQDCWREHVGNCPAQIIYLDEPGIVEALNTSIYESSNATPVFADQLAYVIYTSGSTGQPKGVMITHQNICNHLYWRQMAYGYTPRDRFLQQASASFDVSLWELFVPLLTGGRAVLAQPSGQQDSQYLLETLAQEAITVVRFGPSMLAVLLEERDLGSSLRQVFCGGEELTATVAQRFSASCQAELHHQYGATETTIAATTWHYEPATAGARLPVGSPLSNTQAYVLDSELQAVPRGVVGEVYIGGLGVARGYWQRPMVTAERFVPNPFGRKGGERLYRTGDSGRYRADGLLEYVGRRDQQVKVRGYRIEPGEIEAVLRRYPGVQEALVLARQDAAVGTYLVAYIVGKDEQIPSTVEEIRDYLRKQLPDYMVPTFIVGLEALPLTANGKVDRKALPVPEKQQRQTDQEVVAPRTPLEELLASLWCEVLKRSQIGVHENFFEAGGHSLLATQLIARLRSVSQVELPLRSLFEAPTIAGLAQRVEQAMGGAQQGEAPPLVPAPRTQNLPLSFAQQRLWFLDQLEPGSRAYLIPSMRRLSGPLDTAALERSLEELVRRHESLRTTFHVQAGKPLQVIHPASAFCLPLIDLCGLEQEEGEREARRLARQEAEHPCDLMHGPLLRVWLLRLTSKEHVLLLTMHHIISDGWSMQVLVRELVLLYRAFAAGQPSPLPLLPIQYTDFALWQRRWLQDEVLETQMTYWRQQLAGVPPLELPMDHPRPPVQSFRGASLTVRSSVALQKELNALSRREGVTLFMTLLAAFQVLLARYSGQNDINMGVPIANRTRTELEGLIGFFVNTLVLRTNLAGDPSFVEVLRRVREVALGAYTHQDMPFEYLVEELQAERDLSRNPLFQVMFILQNVPSTHVEASGVDVSPEEMKNRTEKFDLTLALAETPQGLRGQLSYNIDLFERSTISRMIEHWQTLLEGIIAHPEQKISDLPLLTPHERQQHLIEWNNTQRAVPSEIFLHQGIEAEVERQPDAVTVGCDDEYITYRELNRQANKIAHILVEQGVGPEVAVALLADRNITFLTAILAIFKAGGVYLPLDPLFPTTRLSQMLGQSHCAFVLTTNLYLPILLETLQAISIERRPKVLQVETLSEQGQAESNLPTHGELRNLAYVIYTSGSTGTPKGVMVEHKGMLNHMYGKIADLHLSAADIVAQNGPQCFDISVWQCFAALLLAGRVQIFRDEVAFNTVRLLEQIEEKGITVLQLVPSMLREIIHEATSDGPHRPDMSALRWVVPTGDALPADLCYQWLNVYPQIPLLNTYGSTECSDDQCHYPITSTQSANEWTPTMTIGSPIANMRAYVLDRTSGLVPVGVVGELYIGGVGVGRGYVNDPVQTARAFLPDPFSTEAGMRLYRTGDRARYLAGGTIEFLGRVDHLVKIRGYRIELGEIETVLGQHPQLRTTVVVAREAGAGKQQLVAYIVPEEPEAVPSRQALRSYLQGKLPDYMIPSQFVALEALPLTSNGKIDRRALPMPKSTEGEQPEVSVVAPRTPAEEVIAAIWMDILGLSQVGVYDDFFTIGGHSLLATQVISRLCDAFQVELPLRSLFEAPTIDGLICEIARIHGGREIVEEIAQVLKEIEHLTEDEVKQQLSNKV